MTIKIPNGVIFAVLIGLAILIFTAIRGCNNSTQVIADNKILTHNLDSSIKQNKSDTLKWLEKEKDYQDQISVINGQLGISQNRDASYKDSLDDAYARITSLTNKHVPVKPNPDTSITTVPNEYVSDCESCFTELTNGKELVKRANAERDNLQQTLQSKINLQSNRISDLTTQNKALQGTLTDAFEIAKKQEKELAPRGRLYLSLSLAAKNYYYIIGAGGGVLYMDKRQRGYGGNVYGTNIGPMVIASYYIPLSSKRRQ